VFRHVSDTFHSPQGGQDKKSFKDRVRSRIEAGEVSDVIVWDFVFDEGVSRANRTGTVLFFVKVKGSLLATHQDLFYRVRAKFHLDSDNQWRLETFSLLDPVGNQEIPIPF
jgi:hypothetical protein